MYVHERQFVYFGRPLVILRPYRGVSSMARNMLECTRNQIVFFFFHHRYTTIYTLWSGCGTRQKHRFGVFAIDTYLLYVAITIAVIGTYIVADKRFKSMFSKID